MSEQFYDKQLDGVARMREAEFQERIKNTVPPMPAKALYSASEVAELQRENERLRKYERFYDATVSRYDNDAWEAGGGVPALNWAEHMIQEKEALTTQLEEARGQVAAAVEVLEDFKNAMFFTDDGYYLSDDGLIYTANSTLKDLSQTAQAYTEKLRAEGKAELIGELEDFHESERQLSGRSDADIHYLTGIDETIKTAKELANLQQTKEPQEGE